MRTILDIDYRPVLWGLTARGDGATRYVRSDTVTAHLQAILPKIDLVVGTIEEFNIAGGSTDIIESLTAVRRVTPAVLLVKRGPLGCAVIDGPIPRSLDDAFNGRGVDVEVLNVLGAGDAFSAGFLSGWVRGEDYDACCRYANACGALVVSRHGCAPAMPTRDRARLFSRQRRADSATRPGCDADPAASRHRAARGARPGVRLRLRPSQPVLRARAGGRRRRSAAAEAEEAFRRGRRADRSRARARRIDRHALRRSLRPGCAERRDRTRLVDRQAGRAAGLESAGVRSRPVGRDDV